MELWHENPSLPILYLDDQTAGATNFFILRGVTKDLLIPVNKNRQMCKDILEISGVNGTAANIDDLVMSFEEKNKKCAVVWLDYECRHLNVGILQSALNISPYVVVTLAVRGMRTNEIIDNLQTTVKKAGGVLLSDPVKYSGKSGVRNMLHAMVGSKYFGSVNSTKSKDHDCLSNCGIQSPPAIDFVGRTVYIPTKEWGTVITGYDDVKQHKKCLVFRVMGTHYKKNLRLRAIRKNNRLHARDEPWWLSPQLVQKYISPP